MAETDIMEKQSKVKPTLVMKQRAVKYYNENGVPKCLEGLLNKMFLDDPDDIYGYMAEYFAAHSKEPSISKFVTSVQGLFDNGPLIEIPKVKSKPATGSRGKADKKGAAAHLQMSSNQIDLQQDKKKHFDFLKTKDDIYKTASKIQGQRVKEAKDMDELIQSLYKEVLTEKESIQSIKDSEEEAEKGSGHPINLCLDCQRKAKINQAELYFSLLSAKLSSELTKIPLYQSIHDSYNEKKVENWTLPVPLISVMKCGSESPGKLNMVKTVYLAPKPGKSYFESFQKLSAVHRDLGQSLQQKLGVNGKLTTSDGSYLPNLERPEQIFEFLEHACNSAGIDFEQDIDLVLDIGASYFYEEEKKRYQISTGNFKVAEELILMYSEFVEKYPIIGIIDGISFKDVDGCNQLCKAMSGNCYCFGDLMFEGNVEKIEDKIDEQQCFGAVLRLGNYFNNISELSQLSSFVRDKECGIIIPNTTQQGCACTLIPEMAMAIESTFIALGAATQNETIQAVNHFIDIENELLAAGKLQRIDSYSFPMYKEAEVPEDEQPVENNLE